MDPNLCTSKNFWRDIITWMTTEDELCQVAHELGSCERWMLCQRQIEMDERDNPTSAFILDARSPARIWIKENSNYLHVE
jgi:hypothetical protein